MLREQLAEGRFARGVPGEMQLMKDFGVARVTVRKALESGCLEIENADFAMVPKVAVELDDKAAHQAMKLIDRLITVAGPEAIRRSKELASKEGIFVGISSGGNLAAALKVAEKAEPGSVILTILADTGERYLSTVLFEGVNEGSDEV